MRRHRHLRAWDLIHTWTSLGCTVFLLLLCLTGLPLIFHDEIGQATTPQIHIDDSVDDDAPLASLDRIVEAAMALHPTMHPLFVSHEPHEPRIWYVTLASPSGDRLAQAAVDARNSAVVGRPRIGGEGVMAVILALHVDLFAGLTGKLFLGMMGTLFVGSLISGVMLYGPFMRRREFGAVRRSSGRKSRWLDLHNLLGIVTLLWAGVVGFTGVINTCADLLLGQWRSQVLSQLQPRPVQRHQEKTSVQAILSQAASHMHDSELAFIAFPGSSFAGESMYGVYSRGNTPLTSRLVRPLLLDAQTATIISDRPMPWYLTLLLISQPLHFGDYGGLPLKILWALLDVIIIVILLSGVYLWLVRRWRRRAGGARVHNSVHGAV